MLGESGLIGKHNHLQPTYLREVGLIASLMTAGRIQRLQKLKHFVGQWVPCETGRLWSPCHHTGQEQAGQSVIKGEFNVFFSGFIVDSCKLPSAFNQTHKWRSSCTDSVQYVVVSIQPRFLYLWCTNWCNAHWCTFMWTEHKSHSKKNYLVQIP